MVFAKDLVIVRVLKHWHKLYLVLVEVPQKLAGSFCSRSSVNEFVAAGKQSV